MRTIFFLLLLVLEHTAACAQKVWYVHSAASGANDGTTWANAFTSLQSALAAAQYGDQVWVAAGTYRPTGGAGRLASFLLPAGVQLLGGFSGAETDLAQRDAAKYAAVLSGDIGAPGFGDNAYHVVTILGGDSLTVLDGFVIREGEAANLNDSPFPDKYGGGVVVLAGENAPVAAPVIRYCRFERNRATLGGALACLGSTEYACIPDVRHCVFTGNRGEIYGGAFYKTGINRPGKPFLLYDCNFEANYCKQYAGGAVIEGADGAVQIRNCRFSRDSSLVEAGGMFLFSLDYNIRYEIDSCRFTENYSRSNAGGFSQIYNGDGGDTVAVFVKNCYFLLNNTYFGQGGGFFSAALPDVGLHRVSVQTSTFEKNFSVANFGGGISIQGSGSTNTDVSIDRCLFLENRVSDNIQAAGAFYYRSYGATPMRNRNTITNSVFMFNDGAITSLAGKPGTTDTRVVNCSFFRNGEMPFVKYWSSDFNGTTYYMNMQILNSVLWEPEAPGPAYLFNNNTPDEPTVHDYRVEHCIVNLGNCSYGGDDPCGAGMLYAQRPFFTDTLTGLSLQYAKCSPGHNDGSNIVADTFGLLTDFEGLPRIFGDTVDIGAYELQAYCTSSSDGGPPLPSRRLFLHAANNPVAAGADIRAEIVSTRATRYRARLLRADGIVVCERESPIAPLLPDVWDIPTAGLAPGVYLLTARTEDQQAAQLRVAVLR